MDKDKYLLHLEAEFLNTKTSSFTYKSISNYIYERNEQRKDFIISLSNLGFFNSDRIIELNKGNLDTIFNLIDNYDVKKVEISDYTFTFNNPNIKLIDGHLFLNRENKVIIRDNLNRNVQIPYIKDNFLLETNLNINFTSLYAKMFYDDINLFIGSFGSKEDKNIQSNLTKIKYLKDKIYLISDIKLDLYSKNDNDTYQNILYNPKKLLKKVDK